MGFRVEGSGLRGFRGATLNPKPETLNPKPVTRNPKPETPQTPNPQFQHATESAAVEESTDEHRARAT